ncbi:hypothetical protein B0H13DRAFT_1894288 [Mycena leptocephala]|nr:hypothetical protein B0H13DRAFT_1894288 [Mycena leptocephala]
MGLRRGRKMIFLRCESRIERDAGQRYAAVTRKFQSRPHFLQRWYGGSRSDRRWSPVSIRKREQLLNQIREQASQIQKLRTQLEVRHDQPRAPDYTATHTLLLTPSPSFGPQSLYFGNGDLSGAASDNANQISEEWIALVRDSLAESDSFIGIGGAGVPKSNLVKEDLQDSSSTEEDDADEGSWEDEYEIEVLDSEGEEIVRRRGRPLKKRRRSTGSSSTGGPGHGGRAAPKRDFGNPKLVTLPSKSRAGSPEDMDPTPAQGVAYVDFFRSSPIPDPMHSRPLGVDPAVPHILTEGLITPQEAENLFDMCVDDRRRRRRRRRRRLYYRGGPIEEHTGTVPTYTKPLNLLLLGSCSAYGDLWNPQSLTCEVGAIACIGTDVLITIGVATVSIMILGACNDIKLAKDSTTCDGNGAREGVGFFALVDARGDLGQLLSVYVAQLNPAVPYIGGHVALERAMITLSVLGRSTASSRLFYSRCERRCGENIAEPPNGTARTSSSRPQGLKLGLTATYLLYRYYIIASRGEA